MPTDPPSVVRLGRHGVPRDFALAARHHALKRDLPMGLVIAVGEQESGWRNVWGHDAGKYREDGLVTAAGVRRYFAAPASRRPNGVGPMQLTSPGLQHQAQERGGLHLVAVNVAVAVEYLDALIRSRGEARGVEGYNGSGPAARAYADRVLQRATYWGEVIHRG